MNIAEFHSKLLCKVSDCVLATSSQTTNLGEIYYYRGRPSFGESLQENLIDVRELEAFFAELLEGGPSWVHAHALKYPNLTRIGLTRGDSVGAPFPSINMTWDSEIDSAT